MSGMRLSDIVFTRLLPQFMRNDEAVRGLAAAIDQIVPQLAASISTLRTWDCIDDLSEAELDDLADELNILWYSKDVDIATKRELVTNSDKVYAHLGTKWAVENVIQTYFGDGYIKEWYEYGGEPGTFRVYSGNPSVSGDRLEEFLSVLNTVKRHSAKLEGIYITLSGEMALSAGVAVHEISHEQYGLGSRPI